MRIRAPLFFPLLLIAGVVQAQPQPPAAPVPQEAAGSNQDAAAAPENTPPKDQTQEFLSDINLEKSLNLRDPFRRPKFGAAEGVADGGTLPELERFGVDQYRLVGVITGMKRNKALVSDPDGKIYIVSDGMRIGTRRGTVRRILPGKVSVEEKVVNILGQEEKVESIIIFKDPSKESGKEGG